MFLPFRAHHMECRAFSTPSQHVCENKAAAKCPTVIFPQFPMQQSANLCANVCVSEKRAACVCKSWLARTHAPHTSIRTFLGGTQGQPIHRALRHGRLSLRGDPRRGPLLDNIMPCAAPRTQHTASRCRRTGPVQ